MSSGDAAAAAARLGSEAARRLARKRCCTIGPGLTDAEVARIERDYGFEFSDDHRAFLAAGLPLDIPAAGQHGRSWPDWRGGDRGSLLDGLRMIPVYGHRYLPAGRGTYGHPVLSIYQTDIIVYGTDIADYIDCEFGRRLISDDWSPPWMVPFWPDFL